MSDYQLLIFDWDGTLADSIGRIVESVHQAADVCQLPRRSDERVRGIIGLALDDAIVSLYPEIARQELLGRFRRYYSESYVAQDEQAPALFEGVCESLELFRAQGYRLAEATGKTRRGLDRALQAQGWQAYFDITRCADESAGKPDPLMLRQIMDYCAVAPERALMVGDSVFDLQMARNAGVDSVAVGYGAQSLALLETCGPSLQVSHFNELRAWLRCAEGKGVVANV